MGYDMDSVNMLREFGIDVKRYGKKFDMVVL